MHHRVFLYLQIDPDGIAAPARGRALVVGPGGFPPIRLVAPALEPGLAVSLDGLFVDLVLQFTHDVVKAGHHPVHVLNG
jgi:hypothetical protein